MSTATQIERIQNAKTSIKTAIENKGVEVGDGLIDTYATKIDEISSGGTDIEINDCSYLFYNGARKEIFNDILKVCKNVTDTRSMFANYPTAIEELDLSGFVTSKTIAVSSMFSNAQFNNLNLSDWDLSSTTDISYLFYNCYSLISLDLSNWNTSNINNMSNLFYYCNKLTLLNIGHFDVSNVTDMSSTFGGLTKLTELNLSNWDCSKVNNINNLFYRCDDLTNLIFMNNLGKGFIRKTANYSNYKLDLSKSTKLTHDSLMNVINNLYDLNLTYDVANGGTLYTQTLQISSQSDALLSDEEKAIAINKGWTIAVSS